MKLSDRADEIADDIIRVLKNSYTESFARNVIRRIIERALVNERNDALKELRSVPADK